MAEAKQSASSSSVTRPRNRTASPRPRCRASDSHSGRCSPSPTTSSRARTPSARSAAMARRRRSIRLYAWAESSAPTNRNWPGGPRTTPGCRRWRSAVADVRARHRDDDPVRSGFPGRPGPRGTGRSSRGRCGRDAGAGSRPAGRAASTTGPLPTSAWYVATQTRPVASANTAPRSAVGEGWFPQTRSGRNARRAHQSVPGQTRFSEARRVDRRYEISNGGFAGGSDPLRTARLRSDVNTETRANAATARAPNQRYRSLPPTLGKNPWLTTAIRGVPTPVPAPVRPLPPTVAARVFLPRAGALAYSAACARIDGSYRWAAYEHRPRPFGSQVAQFRSAGTGARTRSDRIWVSAARSQCSSLGP